MGRLAAVEACEEEPIRSGDATHSRHSSPPDHTCHRRTQTTIIYPASHRRNERTTRPTLSGRMIRWFRQDRLRPCRAARAILPKPAGSAPKIGSDRRRPPPPGDALRPRQDVTFGISPLPQAAHSPRSQASRASVKIPRRYGTDSETVQSYRMSCHFHRNGNGNISYSGNFGSSTRIGSPLRLSRNVRSAAFSSLVSPKGLSNGDWVPNGSSAPP